MVCSAAAPVLGHLDQLVTSFPFRELFQGGTLVHRQMVGRVTFDQILRLILRGTYGVALEFHFRGNSFLDRPPDSARLRIPRNMIPYFEISWHGWISFTGLD